MANWKLRELRGTRRRRFLKLMGAAAAGFGIERSGLLNFLSDEGGTRLAEAATQSGHRALAVSCGNGSYAWFQELWPVPEVADRATKNYSLGDFGPNDNFGGQSSYLYTPEHGFGDAYRGTLVTSAEGKPFWYSPDAPWFDHGQGIPLRPMTAMLAGNDETHTEFPESAAIVSGNASLTATVGAIQAQMSSALVPVIGIDPLKYGVAQGAPDVVTAPSAEGIVDLFNSAASQLVLASPDDQEMFETYYNSLVKLRRSAGRSSWKPQLEITRNAARLIGLNFAAALMPTADDLELYGIGDLLGDGAVNNAQRDGLEAFGRTLITVARAFKLGLSNSAIVGLSPGPTGEQTFTDPHDTGDGATQRVRGRGTSHYLGRILDGFYADLASEPDPDVAGTTMDETTVFFAWGDTPHTPLQLNNWPDATPQDSNWIYCMGQGHLKHGWYGTVRTDGDVEGWDPQTGDNVVGKPATNTSTAAGAAVAYAVAKGDMNNVAQYYVGEPIDGIVQG